MKINNSIIAAAVLSAASFSSSGQVLNRPDAPRIPQSQLIQKECDALLSPGKANSSGVQAVKNAALKAQEGVEASQVAPDPEIIKIVCDTNTKIQARSQDRMWNRWRMR